MSASRSGAAAGSASTRNSRQSAKNGGSHAASLGPLPRLTSSLVRLGCPGAGESIMCAKILSGAAARARFGQLAPLGSGLLRRSAPRNDNAFGFSSLRAKRSNLDPPWLDIGEIRFSLSEAPGGEKDAGVAG